jgi:hypothetical protein
MALVAFAETIGIRRGKSRMLALSSKKARIDIAGDPTGSEQLEKIVRAGGL